MADVNPTASAGGVVPLNLQGMDIETMLMAVQSQRAQMLDDQIKTQLQGVQDRNDQIARLNTVLSTLTAMQNNFPSDAKPNAKFGGSPPWTFEKNANDALKAAGITDLGFTHASAEGYSDSTGWFKTNMAGRVNSATTKAEIDTAITTIKGQIDSASNSQQMDMLRLQSLTNKRNEAYDIMTNFVKKMQDARSSIIANMR